MSRRYSVDQLRALWDLYHQSVHNISMTPCDACPGDPCYTTSFLDWLERRETKKDAKCDKADPEETREAWGT